MPAGSTAAQRPPLAVSSAAAGQAPGAQGRGRRYIEHADHQVTHDFAGMDEQRRQIPAAGQGQGWGRKQIGPEDSVKYQLTKPVEDIEITKPPSNAEMKDAIKEWVVAVHNMVFFDERRWTEEVQVKPGGSHWIVEAVNPQKRTLTREGPTARAIAEKLSMMPIVELRHFGLRFAGKDDASGATSRREKRSPFDDNPTLVSPGVHTMFGQGNRTSTSGTELSWSRQDKLSAVQRRYIASGKDNFESHGRPHDQGEQGLTARDTDFIAGLEKGIGQGKRYIGTKDSVPGVIYGGVKGGTR